MRAGPIPNPVVLIGLLGLISAPSIGLAWQHRTCNGVAIRWDGARAPMDIEACSIPPASRRAEAVWYGLTEWNSVGGMPAVFAVGEQHTCGMRHGDGRSTIAYVDPAHIDGSLGVTRRYYTRGCWRWAFDLALAETDVMLSAALDTRIGGRPPVANLDPSPRCERATLPSTTERATVLHELGHALGLDHEDDALAMMMSREGEGRFCGERPFMPHPDDAAGVRRLYGDRGRVAELAASPWRWAGPDRMAEVHALDGADALPPPAGCAGTLFSVQYSVANLGTADTAYRLYWFASRDDRVSWDDQLLGVSGELPIGAEEFVTRQATLRMSRNLEPEVNYRLGFIAMPTHPWADERRQGNNTAFIRPSMRRSAEVDCP